MQIYTNTTVKLGTGRVTHALVEGAEHKQTLDLSGQDIVCGRWSKSGEVHVQISDTVTCKSCASLVVDRATDEVLEDQAGTWHPVTGAPTTGEILAQRGSQRAVAPSVDGPARFRARHGKRKASNHRRGR
jgi:hypothetical protein